MYRCERFANVPRNRRRAALELSLPLWSPFPRTGHHCVWQGDAAMVWFWDASVAPNIEACQADVAAVFDGDGVRVRPETVFHPQGQDGFRLQGCHHGVEMQYWRAGALLGSFWQRQAPDKQRIDWFFASVGESPGAGDYAADVAPPQPNVEPWATPETPREWLLRNERRLAAAALALIAAALLWQEARIWRVHWAAAAAAAQIAERGEEMGPTLAARDEARRLRRRNLDLAAILNAPSQARLMGLVHESLPDAEAEFRQWRYNQGDLAVELKGQAIDRVRYVQGLEQAFDQVDLGQAQQPEHIDVRMQVRGAGVEAPS